MNRTLRRLCVGLGAAAYVVLCSLGAGSCNPGTGVVTTQTCLQCHNGRQATDQSTFTQSAHNFIECEGCHGAGFAHVRNGGRGGLFINNPEKQPFNQQFQVCTTCHQVEVNQYKLSDHFKEEVTSCFNCHDVHKPTGLVLPAVDNTLCLNCHALIGMPGAEEIEAHTHHPVDPAGSGASRCVACHMPPLAVDGPTHEHSLETVPPIVSALAAEANQPVPPNSCAGHSGCHDGSTRGEPVFDLNNPAQMRILQTIYETWFADELDDEQGEAGR
jgi:predicted CXXCH cytochrome family protein